MAKKDDESKREIIDVLGELAATPMPKIEALIKRVNELAVGDIRDFAELSKKTKDLDLDGNLIRNGLTAVMTFSHASAREKKSIAEVIAAFCGDELKPEAISKISAFADAIQEKTKAVLQDVEESVAPAVSLESFKGMYVRVLSIAEFAAEFNIGDPLDDYNPKIERQHPRLLVTLRLGESSREVPFLADHGDISHMLKFLQFAQKQLECVTELVKQEKSNG